MLPGSGAGVRGRSEQFQAIAERHVAKFHRAAHVIDRLGVAASGSSSGASRTSKTRRPAADGTLHHVVHSGQRLDRSKQSPPVGPEGNKLARRKPAGLDAALHGTAAA